MTTDYKFKIIVIGNAGVGKTAMVAHFVGEPVPKTYVPTKGIHYLSRNVSYNFALIEESWNRWKRCFYFQIENSKKKLIYGYFAGNVV